MPGLLILRMIIRHLAIGKGPDAFFSIKDLETIRVNNGNLEGFMNNWEHVLSGMKVIPPEDIQHYFFLAAIKNQKDLHEDIAHYDRLEEDSTHPDRSFRFLKESVARAIKKYREDTNRRDLSKAIGRPALAAPTKEERQRRERKKQGQAW